MCRSLVVAPRRVFRHFAASLMTRANTLRQSHFAHWRNFAVEKLLGSPYCTHIYPLGSQFCGAATWRDVPPCSRGSGKKLREHAVGFEPVRVRLWTGGLKIGSSTIKEIGYG